MAQRENPENRWNVDEERCWREEERRRREADRYRTDWMTYGRARDYERRNRGPEYEPDYRPERGSYGRRPEWRGDDRGYDTYDRDRTGRGDYGPEQDYEYDQDRYEPRIPGQDYTYDRGRFTNRGIDRDYSYNRGQKADYDPGYDWEASEYSEEEPYSWTYTEYWLIPGPFTGLGPEGYQRADDRIFENVCERLTKHGQLDARNIEVEIQDGEVTLNGTVHDRSSKRMAEDAIDTLPGVRDVHNRLRVEQRGRGSESAMGERLREDMRVIGSEGEEVGTVKKIRQNDFLVDRSLARDVFIPFHAANIEGDKIKLNIRAGQVDDQNWPSPELIETPDVGSEERSR